MHLREEVDSLAILHNWFWLSIKYFGQKDVQTQLNLLKREAIRKHLMNGLTFQYYK